MAVHPCRAKQDKGVNPHHALIASDQDVLPPFKMHACNEGEETTLCGLETLEPGRRHAYGSVCPNCFPSQDGQPDEPADPEDPWDDRHPDNRGDVIGGRGAAPETSQDAVD